MSIILHVDGLHELHRGTASGGQVRNQPEIAVGQVSDPAAAVSLLACWVLEKRRRPQVANMLAEPGQAAVLEPEEVSSDEAPDKVEGTEQNGPGLSDSGRLGGGLRASHDP